METQVAVGKLETLIETLSENMKNYEIVNKAEHKEILNVIKNVNNQIVGNGREGLKEVNGKQNLRLDNLENYVETENKKSIAKTKVFWGFALIFFAQVLTIIFMSIR